MGIEKVIPSELELVNIFGVNDNNLKYIKSMFPLLKINVRGNVIYIDGDKKEASEVLRILDEMVVMSANKEVIEQSDVELLSKINTETKRNGKKISSVEIIDNKSIKVKNKASVKAAKKLIDKDPSLKKNIEDLKRISDKIKVDTEKKMKELPPESQEYLKKLFG